MSKFAPLRAEAARMLRDYVGARIEHVRAGEDREAIMAAERRADGILDTLWADAIALAQITSDEVRTAFYVSSLNDIISDHARHAASMENQVPEIILWLLYLVAFAALGMMGYACGFGNGRHTVVRGVLVLTVAATIHVVIDLDRPRSGSILVNERHLSDLEAGMRAGDALP